MTAAAGTLILAEVASDLVPSPVEYAALLPPGRTPGDGGEALPLFLWLHGGSGDRGFLATRARAAFEQAWAEGALPPVVIVTPSVTKRCFYMDYRDGSERWETFILGPFVDHLRAEYPVDAGARMVIGGVSMGGMGSLRLAFKYPERFAAVTGLEPGIEPAFRYVDIVERHRFYRPQALFERMYGDPVDEEYWAANNPANVAVANGDAIRASGLEILIEAGDRDFFNLHEATEFLHRVLWDRDIDHEYHLVRRADHVGITVPPRIDAAIRFAGRALIPDSRPDPDRDRLHQGPYGDAKRAADERSPRWRGEFAARD